MTQQEKVIAMLEQAGPEGVTSNQFYNAFLPRFSARIHELRSKGFDIRKEPVENGHFRYILVGSVEAGADRPGNVVCGGSGDQLHRELRLEAPGGTLRDGAGRGSIVTQADVPSSEESAVPEPLFEVDEDSPRGPVNPYQWESAA